MIFHATRLPSANSRGKKYGKRSMSLMQSICTTRGCVTAIWQRMEKVMPLFGSLSIDGISVTLCSGWMEGILDGGKNVKNAPELLLFWRRQPRTKYELSSWPVDKEPRQQRILLTIYTFFCLFPTGCAQQLGRDDNLVVDFLLLLLLVIYTGDEENQESFFLSFFLLHLLHHVIWLVLLLWRKFRPLWLDNQTEKD